MNRTLLMLLTAAATMGATAARADDHQRAGRFGEPRREAGREGWRQGERGREGWRERNEWREHEGWRRGGHSELRRVERWVGGSLSPRWVPGSCYTEWGQTRCTEGGWQQLPVPPHLEVREEWVWVPDRW